MVTLHKAGRPGDSPTPIQVGVNIGWQYIPIPIDIMPSASTALMSSALASSVKGPAGLTVIVCPWKRPPEVST